MSSPGIISCQPASETDPGLLASVCGSSQLARRMLRLRTTCCVRERTDAVVRRRRRRREMTPAGEKDSTYWDKRRKNNEAAKRSRERRRLSELMLEAQLLALSEENTQLRAQVLSLTRASPPPAGPRGDTPVPVLGGRHHETAGHFLEGNPPYFGSGAFQPRGAHRCVGVDVRRSAEATVDAQRRVPILTDNSASIRASLPALHRVPTLSYTPPGRLVSHLSPLAVCNNLLMPWRPPYGPPALHPGLPLYIQERQGQVFSLQGDVQRGFMGRFSCPPQTLLRPDGH